MKKLILLCLTVFFLHSNASAGPKDHPVELKSPKEESVFTPYEASNEILFKWTSWKSKPKEPVTYRLRIWQLLEGQNGTEAMNANKPLVIKDVEEIEQVMVSGIYTGPCKPPYLCDFIWNVEASVQRNGVSVIVSSSTPFLFFIREANYRGPNNTSPKDENVFISKEVESEISFRWTALVPKPKEPVTYRLKVWQLLEGQNNAEAMKTNIPLITKEITDLERTTVSGIYTGPCKPPYLCDFVWSVEAIVQRNGSPVIVSSSTPFSFFIREEVYRGPNNTSPKDESVFTSKEAAGEIAFRWTTLVPKPKEPVTYRLKVWQLLEGQDNADAMKTNSPIVAKEIIDLDRTTVAGIYTGPCKPPYLCDFVWAVEALIQRDGSPVIVSSSTPFSFVIRDTPFHGLKNIMPKEDKVFSTEEAAGDISFRWTPLVPKPKEPVIYRLRVWQLLEGQNGNQASKKNKPIVDTTIEELERITVSGIYTGPCKPPYLCDFVWNISAQLSDVTNEMVLTGPLSEFTVDEKKAVAAASLYLSNPQRPGTNTLYFDSNMEKSVLADIYLTPVTQTGASKLLYSKYQIQHGKNKIPLQLINYSTGIYILNVITPDGIHTQKLIIQE